MLLLCERHAHLLAALL